MKSYQTIPPYVLSMLKAVGKNIKTARLNRNYSSEKLAGLAGTTRETIRRIEHGHPGVGFGYVASVLWALGLEEDLKLLAAPDADTLGQALGLSVRERARDQEEDKYDF